MATNVQERIDEVTVIQKEPAHRNPIEHHVFHTVENIGKGGDRSEWKQRAGAMAIAVAICTVLYGVLYLAMHFQQ
jgi:hypothetical protein